MTNDQPNEILTDLVWIFNEPYILDVEDMLTRMQALAIELKESLPHDGIFDESLASNSIFEISPFKSLFIDYELIISGQTFASRRIAIDEQSDYITYAEIVFALHEDVQIAIKDKQVDPIFLDCMKRLPDSTDEKPHYIAYIGE